MFWVRINIVVYLEKKHIDEKILIPENPGSDKTENKSLLDTNLKNKYIKSHDETHINKRIKTKAY